MTPTLNPSPELVRAAIALRDLLRDPAHVGTVCPHGITGPSCSACLHEGDDPDHDDHRDYAEAHRGPAPGWVGDLSRERVEDGRQP